MWAIPTGASWFCLKKKKKKSPIPESRVPETCSDPPIGSNRDSGRDTLGGQLEYDSNIEDRKVTLIMVS